MGETTLRLVEDEASIADMLIYTARLLAEFARAGLQAGPPRTAYAGFFPF